MRVLLQLGGRAGDDQEVNLAVLAPNPFNLMLADIADLNQLLVGAGAVDPFHIAIIDFISR